MTGSSHKVRRTRLTWCITEVLWWPVLKCLNWQPNSPSESRLSVSLPGGKVRGERKDLKDEVRGQEEPAAIS